MSFWEFLDRNAELAIIGLLIFGMTVVLSIAVCASGQSSDGCGVKVRVESTSGDGGAQ